MRHRKSRLQLNRFTSWRRATLISLAKNLLIYQSIKTSRTLAKAAKPTAERLIRLAKRNTLNARRQAYRVLGDHKLVHLLFNEIGPRFAKIQTGFTRIINFDRRRGDNAQLVVWELTEIKKKEAKRPKVEKEKEIRTEGEKKAELIKEKPVEEKKPGTAVSVQEKPPLVKKPSKKFLGGLRNIFKKERDSL